MLIVAKNSQILPKMPDSSQIKTFGDENTQLFPNILQLYQTYLNVAKRILNFFFQNKPQIFLKSTQFLPPISQIPNGSIQL